MSTQDRRSARTHPTAESTAERVRRYRRRTAAVQAAVVAASALVLLLALLFPQA